MKVSQRRARKEFVILLALCQMVQWMYCNEEKKMEPFKFGCIVKNEYYCARPAQEAELGLMSCAD